MDNHKKVFLTLRFHDLSMCGSMDRKGGKTFESNVRKDFLHFFSLPKYSVLVNMEERK